MYAADSFSSTNLDKSLILYKQAASISYKIKYYEKLVECKQLIAANSIGYNDPVLLYSYLVDFENSLNNFKGYLGDKKQYFELELMLIYINYYVKIGDINKALSILNNHLSILKKINTDGNSKLDDIINDLYNIGELERQNGEFQKAIDDFSELSNLMKFRANDHMMVTRTYQKLAECNIYLNNFSSAEFYYQKALREEAILLKNKKMYREGVWYTIAYLHYSLGKLAFIKKEYDSSLKELNLCISNNLKEKNSFDKLFDTYILKGEIYYNQNKFKDAYNSFSTALSLNLKNLGFKHYTISRAYNRIAQVHSAQKDNKQALNLIQSALISLSQQFNSTDFRKNPSVSDVFSKKDLLETLDLKAGLLLDMAKNQPQYLDAAYQTSQLAAGLIDTIRADYSSDFDKQYLAEWSYGVYEKAIESAYQQYQKTGNKAYLNTAFNAFERSKAIVLLEALRTGQAESALNDDDRNRLYQYKSELQKLEAQIYDETTKNKKAPDDPSVRSLQNRLFEIRHSYEALVSSFETRYPEYYRIKFGQNFARLKEIQALLPNDGSTVALEYFVGEKAIYTFSVSKNDCQLFKTEKPKDFDTRIESMRNALAQNNIQNQQTYIVQASWLYNLILKDPLSNYTVSRQSGLRKLIIIPDGILNYVPFEMLLESDASLLTGNFKYNSLPFLIKKYVISYAYSGNLLKQQSKINPTQARDLFAGFAAQYKPQEAPLLAMRDALTRDNAYDLPNAQKEVADIYNIIGGSLFTKDKAGERYFKDNASYYKILHFAMHAVPDSTNPVQSKLLFTYNPLDTIEDNDLTVAEIYAMHLNAQLAVLSACQTGYGKINRGEGVMSLSRAFAYSGVNSTLMSLWRVSDFSTREIMVEFYKNLKKGQSKDEALRNAKLTYLDNHPQDELKNPYYWAGFVAAGNMSAMDLTNSNMIRWIIVGFLAFIVALILYVRGFKN